MNMKTAHFVGTLIVSLAVIGCASAPEKAAIKDAQSIDFDIAENFENVCYLATEAGSQVLSIDGAGHKPGERFVKPGTRLLTVQYHESNSIQHTSMNPQGQVQKRTDIYESKTDPITLPFFTFEAGKHYSLEYEIEKGATIFSNKTVHFSIVELKDSARLAEIEKELSRNKAAHEAALAKKNEFLAFAKANPHYVDGTWAYSNGYPPIDTEIIFSENRFKMVTYNRMLKFTIITEGSYFFNENIMFLSYEKNNDKEYTAKETIYYELTGNVLNIITIKSGQTVLRYVKGQYMKQ